MSRVQIGPENIILTEVSHSFPQLLNANAKIVPQITPHARFLSNEIFTNNPII
jgi:hypothetical protein